MPRLLIAAAALLVAQPAPSATAPRRAWTPAWTASMWNAGKDAPVVTNMTIRAAVKVGAGGDALRIRLSNEFGDEPLLIGAASVRAADGRSVAVTFAGARDTRIAAGAPAVSDAVALAVKAFEVVEISVYLPERATLSTVHGANGAPTQMAANGDHTAAASYPATARSDARPLIAGVDVLSPHARPVIVAYGDSITDNTGCPNDAVPACRWGDVLGRRLAQAGRRHVVVTQAISGNRVLSHGWGPSALARFDRDVLALPGVTHVVLLEGINDIGSGMVARRGQEVPTTAEALIAGYRQLIARAHNHGVKVIGATILPFKGAGYYAAERDAVRRQVNDWIRTGGAFDGFVDLERVVADPNDPARLADMMQGGDNLHPDGRGETAMGEAIPLTLFR